MSFYNHPFEFSKHNVFRAAHLYSTMPKYWESYSKQYNRLSKYRKPTGTGAGNALAIRHLQRQVNRQKPETQHWLSAASTNFSATSLTQWNLVPCETLAASTDRGDRVLGDTWINKMLEIRFNTKGDTGFPGDIRLVVFIPKKAATSLTFTDINQYVDPNFATVLHDELVRPSWQNNGETTPSFPHYSFFRKINLGNRQCTFIGTTPEKGNVRVAIIGEGERSTGSGITCDVNMRLSYCNK